MLCPQCMYKGKPVNGRCARCGYEVVRDPNSSLGTLPNRSTLSPRSFSGILPQSFTIYWPERGDALREGRYRIMSQVELPETPKRQDQQKCKGTSRH